MFLKSILQGDVLAPFRTLQLCPTKRRTGSLTNENLRFWLLFVSVQKYQEKNTYQFLANFINI